MRGCKAGAGALLMACMLTMQTDDNNDGEVVPWVVQCVVRAPSVWLAADTAVERRLTRSTISSFHSGTRSDECSSPITFFR